VHIHIRSLFKNFLIQRIDFTEKDEYLSARPGPWRTERALVLRSVGKSLGKAFKLSELKAVGSWSSDNSWHTVGSSYTQIGTEETHQICIIFCPTLNFQW